MTGSGPKVAYGHGMVGQMHHKGPASNTGTSIWGMAFTIAPLGDRLMAANGPVESHSRPYSSISIPMHFQLISFDFMMINDISLIPLVALLLVCSQ